MKTWKRVLALITSGMMSIGMIAGCGSSKEVGGPIVLKIGVSTADGDLRNIAAQRFADELAEKTDGNVTAILYPSGQLGGDAEMIDALSMGSGKIDIVISDASNFATYEPKMGISAMPFQFDDFDMAWAFMDSEIEAGVEETLVDNNIRVLTHYCNGFRCVTNNVKPINTPADMDELLIRTPENPVIMATMTALNANPQPLAFSELYSALRNGTYDAQENPIPVIYNNKLYEVQKYLSLTNHIYSGMCFAISENTWKKMSADQQSLVKEVAESSARYDRDLNKQQTESLLTELEAAGMEVNEPELSGFREATSSVMDKYASTYGSLLDEVSAWKETYYQQNK